MSEKIFLIIIKNFVDFTYGSIMITGAFTILPAFVYLIGFVIGVGVPEIPDWLTRTGVGVILLYLFFSLANNAYCIIKEKTNWLFKLSLLNPNLR
jgi:hypothetical protein